MANSLILEVIETDENGNPKIFKVVEVKKNKKMKKNKSGYTR